MLSFFKYKRKSPFSNILILHAFLTSFLGPVRLSEFKKVLNHAKLIILIEREVHIFHTIIKIIE